MGRMCQIIKWSKLLFIAILYLGSNGDSTLELRQFLGLENLNENIIFGAIKSVLQVLVYEQNKLRPNFHLSETIHLLIDENARYLKKFELSIKRYFNVEIDRIDFKETRISSNNKWMNWVNQNSRQRLFTRITSVSLNEHKLLYWVLSAS